MADDTKTPEPSIPEEPTELTADWAGLPHRPVLARMADEELAKFVLGVCDDKIFTMHHIPEGSRTNVGGMVFMPLTFGAFGGWFEAELENIGTVWEYMSEAGPRSINGYPMFFSCRLMHTDDWKRACRAIDKELARRKAATSILDDLKETTP